MIPPAFVHELLARVDIVEVVGRSVELKSAGIDLEGPLPVPRREVAELHRHPVAPDLPLLRLRRARQRDPLPDRAARHGLRRRRQRPRPAGRPDRAGGRRPAGRTRARPRARSRSSATLSDVLAKAADALPAPAEGERRAIAYLKGRGLSGEIAARFGLGYATDGWRGLASVFPSYDDPLLEESGLVIAHADEADGRRRRRRTDRQALRPLPRPHHVPDPLGAGRRDRLRRPGARPRRAEVPELARDAGLQQGPRALRPVRGAHGDPPARLCAGRRGLHGRRRAGPVRLRATQSRRSAPPARPSTCRSSCASPTRSSSASTATPPAAAPPAARSRPACRTRSTRARFRFLFLPPEHDPDSFVRELGAAGVRAARRAGGAAVAPDRRRSPARDWTSPPPKAARDSWPTPSRSGRRCPTGMLKRQLLGEIRFARRLADRRARGGVARTAGSAARPAGVAAGRPAGADAQRRAVRQAMRQPADRHRLDAAARKRLVGEARARPTTRAALRPARLARRAVPLPRPRDRRARRAALGGAARAHRRRAVGRRRRWPWSTARIRPSSRSPTICTSSLRQLRARPREQQRCHARSRPEFEAPLSTARVV